MRWTRSTLVETMSSVALDPAREAQPMHFLMCKRMGCASLVVTRATRWISVQPHSRAQGGQAKDKAGGGARATPHACQGQSGSTGG